MITIIISLAVLMTTTCILLAIFCSKLSRTIKNMDYYRDGCILSNSENFQFAENDIVVADHPGLKRKIYIMFSNSLTGYLRFDKISFDIAMENANKSTAESNSTNDKEH